MEHRIKKYIGSTGASHIFFQDFCMFCIQYLERLRYAKVFIEPLATIEQYRISFDRNTVVVNDIREGHL